MADRKLNKKNKLLAFVFMPLYMIGLFIIVYTVTLLSSGRLYDLISIMIFILATCFVCYIAGPKLNAFQFQHIYVVNEHLSLTQKIKEFKGMYIMLGSFSLVTGLLFGLT
ncbi:MAG: ABC transporter permease [Shouchella clausii]